MKKTKNNLFFMIDYLRNRNYELKRDILDLQEYIEKLEKGITKMMIKNYDELIDLLENIPISIMDYDVHEKVDAIQLIVEYLKEEDWVKEKIKEKYFDNKAF